ncbi:MAG: hypothetical protein ACE5I2_15635, partial [Anaerolineae bacterium]
MTGKKQLAKFSALAMVILISLAWIAAGCGAAPTPQVVEKEVPVEKKVVETVIVEKEVPVEKEVVKEIVVTATPEPKPVVLRRARSQDPKGLDPHVRGSVGGGLVPIFAMYDQLVRL